MYREELKKIWKKETVVLILFVSAVSFLALLLPPLRMLMPGDGSAAVERALLDEWMEEYGSDIDLEEYYGMEEHYRDILEAGAVVISKSPVFAECGVSAYAEYEVYAQNAISGKEGYSYPKYREMRDALSAQMAYDPLYLEVYRRYLINYREDVESELYRLSANGDFGKRENFLRKKLEKHMRENGNGSLLSETVLTGTADFLCRMGILGAVIAAILASPVMVNDRMSHVLALQISGKKGRKIYGTQLLCMCFSVIACIAASFLTAAAVLGKTGVFRYADCRLFSFSTTGIPLYNLSFGRYIFAYMILILMTDLGLGGLFFFLSAKSDNIISMLIRIAPVLAAGVIYLGSLRDMFFYFNPLYRLTGISGIEALPAILFLGAGYGCNAARMRKMELKEIVELC